MDQFKLAKEQHSVDDEKPKLNEITNTKLESHEDCMTASNANKKCCASCHLSIDDKYIFNLMNKYWHEECLQCSQCSQLLHQTCFYKNGLLFCKEDYLK